ncbi:MAG: hypothetical protein FJ161_02875 [Gammaproteobacteria bacterium]|nr:hypothetical protein [Gammaproteobacteria bacterium]
MHYSPYKSLMIGIGLLAPVSFLYAGSELTLGDLAVNFTTQLPPFQYLITGFSYILGIAFVMSGALKIKQHKENPTQSPLSAAAVFIAAGALLVYLPTTVQYLAVSFFGSYSEETGMALYSSATLMDGTSITQQPPS